MRGKKAPKRLMPTDPKYQSSTIAKFINYVMRQGKKTIAQKIVYKCLDLLREQTKQDPLGIFNKVIKKLTPNVEVRSRRVGGANYQIPYQVKGDRRLVLAFRWLIVATKKRKGQTMAYRLKEEILAIDKGEGEALKFKLNTERMAEANRAFAHFAR